MTNLCMGRNRQVHPGDCLPHHFVHGKSTELHTILIQDHGPAKNESLTQCWFIAGQQTTNND